MEGKTSDLLAAISIVVVIVVVALFVMMPQSSSLAHTDQLRQVVNEATRKHRQTLGLLAGPTVTVKGVLPPTFEPGNEENIALLGAREMNTAIPERLGSIEKEIRTALSDLTEASADAKASAYSLVGQILATKAQYYQQSAENASIQAANVMVAIDSGILSIQKHMINVSRITPLTKTQKNVATKMKTDAEDKVKQLKGAIVAKESEIAGLKTNRTAQINSAATHSNKASELRTLSAGAERDQRLDYLEKSFAEAEQTNKANLAADDLLVKIDAAKSDVESMNIELTSAEGARDAATVVLEGFSNTRDLNKGALETETQAMIATSKKIADTAATLITACDKMDADQASAASQYVAAIEAMKQYRQQASDSLGSVSGQGGMLMDQADGALVVVSSRQAVGAIAERLQALWTLAALASEVPKAAEMKAFSEKAEADKTAAAATYAAAATLYAELTTKADKYKWSYRCRELQALRARHRLTGDAQDLTRANLLKEQLSEMKGFPYVDDAI